MGSRLGDGRTDETMTTWYERYMNDILTEIELDRKSIKTTTTFRDGRVEVKIGEVSDVRAAKQDLLLNKFVEV